MTQGSVLTERLKRERGMQREEEKQIDEHCECSLIKDNNVVFVAHSQKQMADSGRWRWPSFPLKRNSQLLREFR